MIELSRPWPLGFGEKRWWLTVAGLLVLLAVALAFDRQISVWAQGVPEPVRGFLAEITPYGESAWILIPAGGLYVVTALLALFVPWRLMRTLLWQFAALYAFIFLGVGVPSLFTTLAKRLIGRGRPMHFDDTGLFGLHWNAYDWGYQSFPSGHATTAAALAMVVGFLSIRWFYPALLFAVAICVSRVALGFHYPSDVVAGSIVGVLGAYMVRQTFAARGWTFRRTSNGIAARPLSSVLRYVALKRRDTAQARRPDRP